MDWKLFVSTFVAVFLAELGDKTQLAAMTFASEARSKWMVFFACSAALVASTAMAVAAGEVVSRFVSPLWLRRGAGLVFVVMGVVFLLKKE